MTKITLNNIGAGTAFQTAIATINANNDAIETAMENTYSRNGLAPNTLTSIMDANSNRIVNLPNAIANSEPITLGQASILNGGGTIQVTLPSGGTTGQVLKKTSNTNYDVSWGTATGTVTSVALSLPADFSISGSPVTTSGTLTGTYVNTPTGTGGFVRATSPALVTPILGTPTSGTLTYCTGLPIAGVSGMGANVGAFLVTPSSANLISAVTDETGTGSLVFGTSPVLTTVDARGSWTTGTSWTLPAFSLGGVVSGNGNQVNNVIVGTLNPLAGTFTTLTGTNVIASTDLTSPIHKSSTSITFQTNGSTFAGSIASNQKWLFGLNTSIGSGPRVGINSNTAASIPNSTVTNDFSLIGADENTAGIVMQAFGSSGVFVAPALTGMRTRGTAAAPTAVASGDYLFSIFGNGYFTSGGTGYSSGSSGLIIKATETHTSTAQGTRTDFYGTAAGATSTAVGMILQSGVIIGTSGTDPGSGNLLATGSILSNSATAGVGYTTGSGGSVTQITSRNTTVVLNKTSGQITLFNAAPAIGTWVTFNVTNSTVGANDTVILNFKNGTNTYIGHVSFLSAGSFTVNFTSTVGTASDSPILQFNVIKGAIT